MTAKYSCNGCNTPIEREDASSIQRQLKDAMVTAYVSGAPENGGDLHLCPACICQILADGIRPTRESMDDERPF